MATAMATMRAALWHGPGDLRVENVPVPEVIPGSVLVKVRACAICGSDQRIFASGNNRIAPPQIIGHEIAGEVVAVGEGVDRFHEGDRVAVGADVPCGECVHCLNDRANCCDTNLAMGYQMDGGFAEYVRLDPIVVTHGPVKVFSDSTPFDLASLAEPLACCINGYERALMQDGNYVVIFGAGAIGSMLAILGKQLGASEVVMIEPSEYRRRSARDIGADHVLDPTTDDPVKAVMELTSGRGADTIFTACSVPETHEQAFEILAKRGVVNLFGGLAQSAPAVSLSSNRIHYWEAYVTGSHGSTPRQHAEALRMIEAGEVDIAQIISGQVPLSKIEEAFETARLGNGMKVVICPDG